MQRHTIDGIVENKEDKHEVGLEDAKLSPLILGKPLNLFDPEFFLCIIQSTFSGQTQHSH